MKNAAAPFCDFGAFKPGVFASEFHSENLTSFLKFVKGAAFLCGHNILQFDLKILKDLSGRDYAKISKPIDTLLLSPLLFPKRPYHRLLKDEKILSEERNNPLSDAKKAKELYCDEVNAFRALPERRRQIFYKLLAGSPGFAAFFEREVAERKFKPQAGDVQALIREEFRGAICENADLQTMAAEEPIELAYSLALIGTEDPGSLTPPWVLRTFPKTQAALRLLRGTRCSQGCAYCRRSFDPHAALKERFGYESFREYGGEPLQENAVRAALDGKSLLAIFPTGGGKSVTFQLPALMAGTALHALTVVISPLQALMKDQIDGLQKKGITSAVTLNGQLDPIERAQVLERLENGEANLLYISPESLRSRTVTHLLSKRQIARFVIDEAHCFSAWGQDFRVDYLYIARFIKKLEAKKAGDRIPVSCFTATAKPKVVTDICEYFRRELGLGLEKFATSATRQNLHYKVLYRESDEAKYAELRELLQAKPCPTIVYVSRTARAEKIAERLRKDAYAARAFHGQMESEQKIETQNAFIGGEVRIIVATSAFGMGIDKEDVGLVVHYDISSSLESYLQEAGRAGRNYEIQADCVVLFDESDLDDNFTLLTQTKLSLAEIQQVWKAVKALTKGGAKAVVTPLELAREAGWDKDGRAMETSIKAAVNALETSGYVRREENSPQIFATAILAETYAEAERKVDEAEVFSAEERKQAKRLLKALISERSVKSAQGEDAESRVDYLADRLSITKEAAIDCINKMRLAKILDDSLDMKAYIFDGDTERKSQNVFAKFKELESVLLEEYDPKFGGQFSLKEVNEKALGRNLKSSERALRTLLIFHAQNGYIARRDKVFSACETVKPKLDPEALKARSKLRLGLASFFLKELYAKAGGQKSDSGKKAVEFSLVGLFTDFQDSMFGKGSGATLGDAKEALLYLSKIGALKIEGGFLVLRNAMQITRLDLRNAAKYKKEDYEVLNEFYKQKIQQIHIVGEYARLMVRDYGAALKFAADYFQLEYKAFIAKYFKGERSKQLEMTITPAQREKLFGKLSERQRQIIDDREAKYIAVAAGPGSGKTTTLVHKLASLLALEDVKAEKLLMLTFSRAAATEFKERLLDLAGNVAFFVQITTFHSYSFDLLGRVGKLEGSESVVRQAAEALRQGEVEETKITKSVLVIDEAQDMGEAEYSLVTALMEQNEDMRVIAVGDDDQNIYEFRGSSSKHFQAFINEQNATLYEMVENYRSEGRIVAFANEFAKGLANRIKTEPIKAVKSGAGAVELVKHASGFMAEALVNGLGKPQKGQTLACLTSTNEEAYQIFKLLRARGFEAKLVQAGAEFKPYNLAELRFFLKCVERRSASEKISEEEWAGALGDLKERYSGSECLEFCQALLSKFKESNTMKQGGREGPGFERTKLYKTDLEEFLRDSQYEDFCHAEEGVVHVSTIHKAKGREFDEVHLALSKFHLELKLQKAATEAQRLSLTEQGKRSVYVALTRAKTRLCIHTDSKIFDGIQLPGLITRVDETLYQRPREILLRLGLGDVNLGAFKEADEEKFKQKKREILGHKSGEELAIGVRKIRDKASGTWKQLPFLKARKQEIQFSKKFVGELESWRAKGYKLTRAKIGYVVAWFCKGSEGEAGREVPVILPDLYLERQA